MARYASRRLLDKLPSPEEMAAAIAGLKLMDDAAAIVMGAAYLDYALEHLLDSHFKVPPTGNERKRMFDGAQNGVLATFSAKTRVARALGLLTEETYDDLLTINNIRNAVAHSLHGNVDFLHSALVEDCGKLSASNARPHAHPAHIFAETIQTVYASFMTEYNQKERFLAAYRAVIAESERSALGGSTQVPPQQTPPQMARSNRARR